MAASHGGTAISIPAAVTSNTGLFGSADPTFDGVYRQALSIVALRRAGVSVPASSITWLLRQQCPDGGFQAYRADLGKPCATTDLKAFTGEDANSTALAVIALRAVGQRVAAHRAIGWLQRAQNPDGGFGYLAGSASDANSTGLVLTAMPAANLPRTWLRNGGRNGVDFLQQVQIRCTGATTTWGALAFQATNPLVANDYAAAQGLAGMSFGLATRSTVPAPGGMSCQGGRPTGYVNPVRASAHYLDARLAAGNGVLASAYGTGADWNTTAWAVLGLASAGVQTPAALRARYVLSRNVDSYVRGTAEDRPAALATLTLVATGADLNPRRFGGADLPGRLLATRTP